MCLIIWESMQKDDPHNLHQGGFWGSEQGLKLAISNFGPQKANFIVFCPVLNRSCASSISTDPFV